MTQKTSKPPNPHDEFTKSVFQELHHARGLFRGYLPQEISQHCDWKTLRLERDAFSSDELMNEFADLLFSVQLKGVPTRQRIRLLFEHKRRPERGTLRQLLNYIHHQLSQTPSADALPCVITILLLQHGRCLRTNLSSEYQLPESMLAVFAPYVLDFRLIPIELSQLGETDLRGTAAGRFALAMLKSVGEGRATGWLEFRDILHELCSHLSDRERRRELRRAFIYLTSSIEPEKEQEVRQALLSAKSEFEPVEEQVMSLLEHLEQRGEQRGELRGEQRGELRGEQRGEQRGVLKGRIQVLSEMLRARMPDFGDAEADRLAQLSADGLAAVQAAFMQDSWATIRKLLRSSRSRRQTSN